jgi:hypothetical protein
MGDAAGVSAQLCESRFDGVSKRDLLADLDERQHGGLSAKCCVLGARAMHAERSDM